MMGAKTYTVVTNGLESVLTPVRVSIDRGLPSFTIIGTKASVEKEIKTIVISQFKQNRIKLPQSKIRIEIDLEKSMLISKEHTLPIFMAILRHIQQSQDIALYYGIITLDGKILSRKGWYQAIEKSKKFKQCTKIVIPNHSFKNDTLVQYKSIKNLLENKQVSIWQAQSTTMPKFKIFDDIIGQEEAKRIALISLSGGHSVYFRGAMGSGKSELAVSMQKAIKYIKYIHPEIEEEYTSAFGKPNSNKIIEPSTTKAIAFPHDNSFAQTNHRIIHIDEFPDIRKNITQTIKQVLDTNKIQQTPVYPTFVFTGNLCPCGNTGSDSKDCNCSKMQQINYAKRISNTMLNRIHLHSIISNSFETKKTDSIKNAYSSEILYNTWEIQKERYKNSPWKLNSHIPFNEFNKYISINTKLSEYLISALKKLNLNRRDYTIILKIARTIADLSNNKDITKLHLLEAMSYRSNI